MGTAERIYELIRAMPETKVERVLVFVEGMQHESAAISAPTAKLDWSLIEAHAGCYDGTRFRREELYDRAGLR